MTITSPSDLGEADVSRLVEVDLDASELPTGVPPEAWAHLAVYRARPDVVAVARAMPPSAFAVGAATDALPPVHGQSVWLGRVVPVHDDARLLRSPESAEAAAASMGDSSAVILRGNGALTVGLSPALAVARMWLLEASADAWLRARSAGAAQSLTDEEAAGWARTTEQLLPRLAAHLVTPD